MHMATIQLRYF